MKTLTTILFMFALLFSIEKTESQGMWTPIQTNTTCAIHDIDRSTGNIFVAVGDSGRAFRSTDGGSTWSPQYIGTPKNILSVSFSNNTGIAVTNTDSYYKTTNSGLNWFPIRIESGQIYRIQIQMMDENNAYITQGHRYLKTTNGGTSWTDITSFNQPYVIDFQFIDTLNGFASTGEYIRKTTNGGLNWANIYYNPGKYFSSIHFINANTGFITTRDVASGTQIFKTTDGGATWLINTIDTYGRMLYDIHFSNENTGAAVGASSAIYRTTNGGNNWIKDSVNALTLFNSVYVTNANNIITAGSYGVLLKYTDLTGISQQNNQIPEGFSLSQNYPNPFNPSTKISFSIPQASFVKMAVYDITGKEVETLVNELMNAGSFEVDFNASKLTSGVYFCRVTAEGFTDVKKMILAK